MYLYVWIYVYICIYLCEYACVCVWEKIFACGKIFGKKKEYNSNVLSSFYYHIALNQSNIFLHTILELRKSIIGSVTLGYLPYSAVR